MESGGCIVHVRADSQPAAVSHIGVKCGWGFDLSASAARGFVLDMPWKVNFQWRILQRKCLNRIQGCSADVVDCFHADWVGMEPDNQDALLLVKDPL